MYTSLNLSPREGTLAVSASIPSFFTLRFSLCLMRTVSLFEVAPGAREFHRCVHVEHANIGNGRF